MSLLLSKVLPISCGGGTVTVPIQSPVPGPVLGGGGLVPPSPLTGPVQSQFPRTCLGEGYPCPGNPPPSNQDRGRPQPRKGNPPPGERRASASYAAGGTPLAIK